MEIAPDRYSKDSTLTAEDFAGCGWKEILASAECKGYLSMYLEFSNAAKLAIDEGREVQGKTLWLLADACSMALSPDNVNEPFKPFTKSKNGRFIMPDDLSETDIAFFMQITDKIDEPWLKARLADLVWLLKRDVIFALAAVDSYLSIPFETDFRRREILECWQRSIRLIRQLREGAGDRLVSVETLLIEKFRAATSSDGFLCLELSNLLRKNDLGKGHALEIASKLRAIASESNSGPRPDIAREYFPASSVWFKTAGEDSKSVEMTITEAENWVAEANNRISSDQPSHMVAASFYEKAIQIYRTIPKEIRSKYRVDEHIASLREQLNESGKKSLDEMRLFSTPATDISELVKNVRDSVKGKSIDEALKTFADLPCSANVKELREITIEIIKANPLQALIPTTLMSHDGRVIAKRPGMSAGPISDNDNTCENEKVIHSKMVEHYSIHVKGAVQGYIWPTHEVLLLEHRLRETDFIALAERSPIVPIGREPLFGKALFAGYDQDFVASLHILAVCRT